MTNINKNNLPSLNSRPLWSFRVTDGKKPRYFIPEVGKYVDSGRVPFYLRKFGMTVQNWYDKWILGILTASDRPKCIICGKEAKFLGLGKGYEFKHNVALCNCHISEAHKICTSIGTKIALSDPEVRIHQSQGQLNSYIKDPNRRDRQSTKMKKRYENPMERKKTSDAVKIGFTNPVAKMNLSKGISNSFINPTESRLNSIRGRGNFQYRYSNWEERNVKLDSSWEVYFFELCVNLRVDKLLRCPFGLRYLSPINNEIHTYLPDFLLNDRYLIEIKPNYLIHDPVNQAKFHAASIYCSDHNLSYVIITEDYLFHNGSPYYGSLPFKLNNHATTDD